MPEARRSDKAHSIARAVLKGGAGSFPVVGSFLSAIIELLYRAPIDKRRERWLGELAQALESIRSRQDDLTPERLAENPEFVTVLHRATDVALKTHETEKLRALRNAVINSALPSSPDLERKTYFLRLVDELSVTQVRVLTLYDDPKGWFARQGRRPEEYLSAGRDAVLQQAMPDVVAQPYFRELVVTDLERRGLLGSLSGMVSGHSVYDRMTSPIAQEFLRFITAPDGAKAIE